ncbi:MAG: 16S rRNA (uracil(1498)-N(3))-methyltransferase [Bacteroidota bacterium]
MQLFYVQSLSEDSDIFYFDKDESRHIVKVLRKPIGDILNITNGNGWMFEAEILDNNIKSVQAKIIKKELQPKPNYHLHMAVAPTKSMERFEWFLEKATEIGISKITPIICENSERKVVKNQRLERIIQSALNQSLDCYLPKLNDTIKFTDFIKERHDVPSGYIAHCAHDGKKISFSSKIEPGEDILILIGPEGDFSQNEIEFALNANYLPVSLGKKRLRTETAAIVACHTVAMINE